MDLLKKTILIAFLLAYAFGSCLGCTRDLTSRDMSRFPRYPKEDFSGLYTNSSVVKNGNYVAVSLWKLFIELDDKSMKLDESDIVQITMPDQSGFLVTRISADREIAKHEVPWRYADGYFFSGPTIHFDIGLWGCSWATTEWGAALDASHDLHIYRRTGGFGLLFFVFPVGDDTPIIGHTFKSLGDKKALNKSAAAP